MEEIKYSVMYSSIETDEKGVRIGETNALLALFTTMEKAENYLMDYFKNCEYHNNPRLTISKTRTQLLEMSITDVLTTGNKEFGFNIERRTIKIEPCPNVDSEHSCEDDIYYANTGEYPAYIS